MLRTSRAEDQVITPVIRGWVDWGLEDNHTVNIPAHKCEHTLQYEDSRGQPRTAEDSGGRAYSHGRSSSTPAGSSPRASAALYRRDLCSSQSERVDGRREEASLESRQ